MLSRADQLAANGRTGYRNACNHFKNAFYYIGYICENLPTPAQAVIRISSHAAASESGMKGEVGGEFPFLPPSANVCTAKALNEHYTL